MRPANGRIITGEEDGGARSPGDFLVYQAWCLRLSWGWGVCKEQQHSLGEFVKPKQVRDEGIGKEGTMRDFGSLETFSEHLRQILSYSFSPK